MLKFKLCRICMKQRKATIRFIKIFESKEMGSVVSDIISDFAHVPVDQNDELPQIICNSCFETLVKCREFQKMIAQNHSTLANMKLKSPNEIENFIAKPFVRIEKVTRSQLQSNIVEFAAMSDDIGEDSVDVPFSQSSSSDSDDDEFPKEVPETPIEPEKPRFSCCCCPLQFSEEHDIIEHMKTDHATIRNKLNIFPVDKDPKFVNQCELCLKYVLGFTKLLEHQSLYLNCKQCVECGGFYQKKTKLECQCKKSDESKLQKDQSVEKIKCPICSSMVRNLKAHNYYQHADLLLTCKKCDFSTYQKAKMVRHAVKHIEKKVPCPYSGCGKMFVSSDCIAMKLHVPRHRGEKRFACKMCGKTFGDNSDCKRHEWQHTGVSPYMCSKCNKMFLRKNHLLAHEAKCPKPK